MTAVSLIWMFLLNGNFGIVNYLLGMIGIEGPKWLSETSLTLPVFAFIYLWRHLGYYMTIMLGGLQGVPEDLYESARLDGADTSGTPWYAAGQSWAVENGVSDGSSLESAVTREQLAAMLYRYADGWASGTAELDGFEDAASISSWAAEAMAWAVGNGIIDGVSEGVLAPQDTATRAQVAAMLQRFVEAG